MRITVLGATGRTGRHVVDLALQAGHQVIAVTRGTVPSEVPDGLTWIEGSVLHEDTVDNAISGSQAVIVALGPSREAPDVCSQGTRLALDACHRHDVQRIVVVTGAAIGHPPDHLGWWMRAMRTTWRAANPHAAHERDEQEAMVKESGLTWTLLHPPRLTEGTGGPTRIGAALQVGANDHVDRIELARAALDAAANGAHANEGVAIIQS
ncbi:MAG: NAD(P)H-binding protein [Myxococcales bacterium]|nr:NAD(P)H-binding protein [Myxococcales bacterium]